MRVIHLIHWNEEELPERVARLESAGLAVRCGRPPDEVSLRQIREDPPDAFVIDLSRLPSHGREVAVALRQSKATRCVPIVFVDGAAEKVQRVRNTLPDATFTTWGGMRAALKAALSKPVVNPVVHKSISGPYSGTPLPKKLGIKPGSTVSVIGAPEKVNAILGPLPKGATLLANARRTCDVILWFVTRQRDLEKRIDAIGRRVGRGSLWIIWPKKTSGVATDVSERTVRETALAHGLVDYKICAVDDTWSGLRFAVRK